MQKVKKSQTELASLVLVGYHIAMNALEEIIAKHVEPGKCTSSDCHGLSCDDCQLRQLLSDARGQLYVIDTFSDLMSGNTSAGPEVRELGKFLGEEFAQYTPAQLSTAVLRLAGGDDVADEPIVIDE